MIQCLIKKFIFFELLAESGQSLGLDAFSFELSPFQKIVVEFDEHEWMWREEDIEVEEGFECIAIPIVVVEDVEELLGCLGVAFEGGQPGDSLSQLQLR